jgi:hypothetical protein
LNTVGAFIVSVTKRELKLFFAGAFFLPFFLLGWVCPLARPVPRMMTPWIVPSTAPPVVENGRMSPLTNFDTCA